MKKSKRSYGFGGLHTLLVVLILALGIAPVYGQGINSGANETGGRFLAFSLLQAERLITGETDPGQDVFDLGGITQLAGFVVDESTGDIIIVGKVNSDEAEIELNDLVIALRSMFVYEQWPLVSIDRTAETERTMQQVVRFEGGVENTEYGLEMLEADVILKQMSLGYLQTGIADLKSYFDLRVDQLKGDDQVIDMHTRFWFLPMQPNIAVRPGVLILTRMNMGVQAEIMAANIDGRPVEDMSDITDSIGREYALKLTMGYKKLCEQYPEIARLRTLNDLVSLAAGLKELESLPDLDYWLYDFPLATISTPETYEVVVRTENYEIDGENKYYTASGGVELRTLIRRLQDGDATALQHAVIHSRPSEDSLTWEVPIEGWQIPGLSDTRHAPTKSADQILEESGKANEELGCSITTQVLNQAQFNQTYPELAGSLDSGGPNFYRLDPGLSTGLNTYTPGVLGNQPTFREYDGLQSIPGSGSISHFDYLDTASPLNDYAPLGLGRNDYIPTFQPEPLSQGLDVPDFRPGGVLINQTAQIESLDGLSIEGVVWNEDSQRLGLILEGEIVELPQSYLDDFIAVVHSVYGGTDPGVSIDPGPTRNINDVRYIGDVEGTRLGWTMFEADRLLKCYTLGRDNLTGDPVDPGIPGYRSLQQIWEDSSSRHSGAMMRMWFVPTEIRASRAGDSLIFEDVTIEVKTEYMALELQEESDPGAVEFINFFNAHFDDFAALHPEIRDLKEYAKLVALVKYIRDRGVPMNWLLFSNNSQGVRYETPATTPGYTIYAEETGTIGIWGGVNMTAIYESFEPSYESVPSFVSPVTTVYSSPGIQRLNFIPSQSLNIGSDIPGINFTQGDASFTSFDLPSSVSTSDGRKLHFQTDAVITGSGPVVELTRYYDSSRRNCGQFGNGWHLLIPYELELSSSTFKYQSLDLPESITVKDMVSGEGELLEFSEADERVGYFPSDDSNYQAVYVLNDQSYILEDIRGSEFHFNSSGKLTVIDMGEENRWAFGYHDDQVVSLWGIPRKLIFDWSSTVQAGPYLLPHEIVVSDRPESEILMFTEDIEGDLGFFNEESDRWAGLHVLANGYGLLEDKWGNEFLFDSHGKFLSVEINQNDSSGIPDIHCIRFVYDENDYIIEAAVGGQGRVQYLQDNAGDLTLKLGIDGVGATYDYDSDGELLTGGVGSISDKFKLNPFVSYTIAIIVILLVLSFIAYRRLRMSSNKQ